MFKKVARVLPLILAVFMVLTCPLWTSQAGAFSVDVKNLYYADYSSPTTARRVVNYNFSGGIMSNGTITLPTDAVTTRPPIEGILAYIFGPYPPSANETNDISMTLPTGASKATMTSAAHGGCIIGTTTPPPPQELPVPQWEYRAQFKNFVDMTDDTLTYNVQVGLGNPIPGPHPEFTASWVTGISGRNLVLSAKIYNDALETTVWGPYTTTLSSFNAATDAIVLRIRCLDPNAGGNSMVFDYSLDGGGELESCKYPYV